jgi:hypothetical protein
MNEYESVRRVTCDFGDSIGMAVFVPVCEKCSRFVRAGTARAGEGGLADAPNAECSRDGAVKMLFEGFT